MNWVAIANMAAGRAGEVARAAESLRRSRRVDALHFANQPGDSARLAREAAAADGLVVLGGDGTIAQVVNAMDRARQTLALIPCGHGNCLARDLGLARVEAALAALHTAGRRRIDLMHLRLTDQSGALREWRAVSTLAVGYVADTVVFGRERLPWLGRHAYAAASVLTRPRSCPVAVEFCPALPPLARHTGVVVNNTVHLANFRAFAQARLDDGLLDVMEQSHGWWRQMLHNAAVLAGSMAYGPARLSQAAAVDLRFAQPELLMVDGDMLPGVRRLEVRCEPQALACVVGADPTRETQP